MNFYSRDVNELVRTLYRRQIGRKSAAQHFFYFWWWTVKRMINESKRVNVNNMYSGREFPVVQMDGLHAQLQLSRLLARHSVASKPLEVRQY